MVPDAGSEEVRVVKVCVTMGDPKDRVLSGDFVDVRDDYVNLLRHLGVRKVITDARRPFNGHSYEMGVVMAVLGQPGVYSGFVKHWNDDIVAFEPADGGVVKRQGFPRLITPDMIRTIRLLPTGATA